MSEELVVKSKEDFTFQDILDGFNTGDLNSILGLGILIGSCKLGEKLDGSAAEMDGFSSKKIVVTEYEGGKYMYEVEVVEEGEDE